MKSPLIVDENIPKSVIKKLESLGYKTYSIREKKPGITDKEIIKFSKEIKQSILTLDKDFGYLIYGQKMQPYGIILLRIHPQSPEIIYTTILTVLKLIEKQEIDLEKRFIVSDGISLRVRKLYTK